MSFLYELKRRKVSRETATNEQSITCFSGRKLGHAIVLLLALAAHFNSVFAGGNASQFEDVYAALRLNATQLDLRGSDVSDADLEVLSNPAFAEVESVLLARTDITDAGIQYLRFLGVKELDLYHTSITDAGLCHLAGIPLERLDLTGTAVTDAGSELGPGQFLDRMGRGQGVGRSARRGIPARPGKGAQKGDEGQEIDLINPRQRAAGDQIQRGRPVVHGFDAQNDAAPGAFEVPVGQPGPVVRADAVEVVGHRDRDRVLKTETGVGHGQQVVPATSASDIDVSIVDGIEAADVADVEASWNLL